jgi:hypothetical protein
MARSPTDQKSVVATKGLRFSRIRDIGVVCHVAEVLSTGQTPMLLSWALLRTALPNHLGTPPGARAVRRCGTDPTALRGSGMQNRSRFFAARHDRPAKVCDTLSADRSWRRKQRGSTPSHSSLKKEIGRD